MSQQEKTHGGGRPQLPNVIRIDAEAEHALTALAALSASAPNAVTWLPAGATIETIRGAIVSAKASQDFSRRLIERSLESDHFDAAAGEVHGAHAINTIINALAFAVAARRRIEVVVVEKRTAAGVGARREAGANIAEICLRAAVRADRLRARQIKSE